MLECRFRGTVVIFLREQSTLYFLLHEQCFGHQAGWFGAEITSSVIESFDKLSNAIVCWKYKPIAQIIVAHDGAMLLQWAVQAACDFYPTLLITQHHCGSLCRLCSHAHAAQMLALPRVALRGTHWEIERVVSVVLWCLNLCLNDIYEIYSFHSPQLLGRLKKKQKQKKKRLNIMTS